MKTQSLIDLLATGAGPANEAPVLKRIAPAVFLGPIISALLAMLIWGPAPIELFATTVPWMKLTYAALLALFAGWLTARLARPIARTRALVYALFTVFVAMLTWGVITLAAATPDQRLSLLMGETWTTCPRNVVMLSMPALAGGLWALRGLAPTNLRAAGFCAGLLAGALGAMGYALACAEASATFVAVWYSLGILLTGLLGALAGPRLLRW